MEGRRNLTFTSLDDVTNELPGLLAGHRTVGQWTLGQILHHLSTTMRVVLTNPPSSTESSREQEVLRRLFFRAGRFPEGQSVPIPAMDPPEGLDCVAEAGVLCEWIARFRVSEGPFPAHPILGHLTKEEWDTFHTIHCAHHLSFVVPLGSDG